MIELSDGIALVDGKGINLTKTEFEIVAVLLEAKTTVSQDELMECCDIVSKSSLSNLVGRLRRKGVPIKTRWIWGYTL